MNKFDSMQMFVRVADAGSFAAVAEQLQVARSVVTRQVAALEQHLGIKLMTRSTRRLALTPAGSEYLDKCRSILSLVEAAEADLAEESSQARGRIRLGLPLTYGLQVLMPVLLDFMQRNPAIELDMDFSDQRSNLIEDGLDLSIRITSDLQPGDIVRKLGQCRLLTLAAPAYLKAHGEPRHPSDLRAHACLVYASAQASNTNWVYQEGKRKIQVAVRGRMVANSGVALCEAAAQGMGITRQPDFIAASFLQERRLRPVLRKHASAPLGVYAVLPSNRFVPHRVNVLIGFLAAALKDSHSSS